MRRRIIARSLVPLLVLTAGVGLAAGADKPDIHPEPCQRIDMAEFRLSGPFRDALDRVTANWLLPAPGANPAILAMFVDRDRLPHRDLLPWSGEFAGKYLTGATQVLHVNGDKALRQRLETFVAQLVALQDADGYLGPFPRGHRLTGQAPNIQGKDGPTWDAWGHYHLMIGLLMWHGETGSPEALAAATRIGDLLCDRFLGEAKRPRLVDTGWPEMNLAPAHALVLLHERTGMPRYLELARQIVGEFAATDPQGKPLAGDYLQRGLAGEPFYKTPKPRWESLHPILTLAALHRDTGDDDARAAFKNLWWSIVETDRHNNGGFSSGEQAQGNPYHPGAIETCCTIAWMAASVAMLELTADPLVADELELSTLNSAMGLWSPSGRWSTYNTPMDGQRVASTQEIVFQARPGSPELNCCSVNAARGLGMVGDWAVTQDARGLFLNWYGPGEIVAPLHSGLSVKLSQETDYPAGNMVRLHIDPPGPAPFALRLRVPHWSTRTAATLNGEPIANVAPGRYLTLDRTWQSGDVVTLTFDFTPKFWNGERECEGRTSIYRGPLLLAYDRRFDGIDPADLPALDAHSATGKVVGWGGAGPLPMVLVEVPAANGRTLHLCDFASAGADGSPYRSWLKVANVAPTPFTRENPRRVAPVAPPAPK